MKEICNFCAYQQSVMHDEVRCAKAVYKSNDYGEFKQGCLCVHDEDLNDFFENRTEESISVRDLSMSLKRSEQLQMRLRNEIRNLKERLVKVEDK